MYYEKFLTLVNEYTKPDTHIYKIKMTESETNVRCF